MLLILYAIRLYEPSQTINNIIQALRNFTDNTCHGVSEIYLTNASLYFITKNITSRNFVGINTMNGNITNKTKYNQHSHKSIHIKLSVVVELV